MGKRVILNKRNVKKLHLSEVNPHIKELGSNIRKEMKKGFSKKDIEQTTAKKGWSKDKAFLEIVPSFSQYFSCPQSHKNISYTPRTSDLTVGV